MSKHSTVPLTPERFQPRMKLCSLSDSSILPQPAMPYIIDGHNLIPKLHGLELSDIDDEHKLVEVLVEFCRRKRKQAEVYFDNAPAGSARTQKFGAVTTRFVRQGLTADAAIRSRLERMGKAARTWTVVSSDLEVQSAARGARAHFLSAEAFAELLHQARQEHPPERGREALEGLSPDEVQDWMELFGGGGE
jgi:uncharacterized protein